MKLCNVYDKKSDTFDWFTASDRIEAERFISTKMILSPTSPYVLYPNDYEIHIFEDDIHNEEDLANLFSVNNLEVVPFTYLKAEYFDPFMAMYESDEDEV